MRDVSVDPVYTRYVYDVIDSGDLTISSSAYAESDYLHDDVITVSNAFLDSCNSFLEVVGVIIRESNTAGTLQTASLKVILFDSCDMSITANDDFDFADGTSTDIDNIKGIIDVSSYTTLNSKNAVSTTTLSNPIPIKSATTNKYFKAIITTNDTTTYDSSTKINISIIIRGH